jgi:Fic family protein
MASAIDDLNGALRGSPYLLEDDDLGASRADFLAEELRRIKSRHDEAEQQFSEQSSEIRTLLREIVDTRLVYESNALEFAGLPLAATERALSLAPSTFADLSTYIATQALVADAHLLEVLGMRRAVLFAQEIAADYSTTTRPLREIDIRSLHAATVPGERFAGSYRDVDVEIAGSTHTPPPPFDVPRQMDELTTWLNGTTAPPPLAAAVVHSWLTIIHPFEDGNGRVARLLANVVLLRAGWPPLIVASSDRLQYLDALSASDSAGNLLPLFDLFVKSLRRQIKQYARPGLARRLFEADLRTNDDLRYNLWSRQIDDFLTAVRQAASDFGFTLDRVGVPGSSTLLLLEERDVAGNTWLAKLRHPDGRDFLLWLGYMSHQMIDNWDVPRPAPSIFVSERDRRPSAVHPYAAPFEGSRLALSEIALIPGLASDPALLRYGLTVVDASIESAAQSLASAIADLPAS